MKRILNNIHLRCLIISYESSLSNHREYLERSDIEKL